MSAYRYRCPVCGAFGRSTKLEARDFVAQAHEMRTGHKVITWIEGESPEEDA